MMLKCLRLSREQSTGEPNAQRQAAISHLSFVLARARSSRTGLLVSLLSFLQVCDSEGCLSKVFLGTKALEIRPGGLTTSWISRSQALSDRPKVDLALIEQAVSSLPAIKEGRSNATPG
eukprot:s5786_g2.t1